MVAILGPTGSGKTGLALDIAQLFDGEVVGCDSVQIYRHFNLGTAKTPLSERRGIPHHLIDAVDPDRLFTAGEYAREGRAALAGITSRGKLPVVVGGTGFYLGRYWRACFQDRYAIKTCGSALRESRHGAPVFCIAFWEDWTNRPP